MKNSIAILFLTIFVSISSAEVYPQGRSDGRIEVVAEATGFGNNSTLTNVYQIIDTNGTTRFDSSWGFDGDYPGRRPFGYLDELTVSASNRNSAAAMGTTFEPSGLVWSDSSNLLYCVDDEGNLISMAFDGTSKVTNRVSGGLDFEAITIAVPTSGYVDIGCERWLSNVATSMIVRMSPTAAFTSANQQRFDVSQIVTSTVTTARMEALTFIPSNAVPSWVPATWTEPLGLYLMSCQNDGYFYLVDVPISTTAYSTNVIVLTRAANMVAAWVPHMLFLTNRNDCADLSFDTRWNRLYAVYDEIGGEVTALSGRGRSVVMFDLALQRAEQEWGLWNNGAAYTSPEGFALGPDRAFCFIANDGGNASANNNIKRYRFDAYGRETRRWMDASMARTPDAEDDAGMGYTPGSQVSDTSTTSIWSCVSSADNAAIWRTVANSLWYWNGNMVSNAFGTLVVSNLTVNSTNSFHIGAAHITATGSDPIDLTLEAETLDALQGTVSAQGDRLDRAEIDLLNNYIYDATEATVMIHNLLWGFADTFDTTNYVAELSAVTHVAADELLKFSDGILGSGPLILWHTLEDNAATTTVTNNASGGYNSYVMGGPVTNTSAMTVSGWIDNALYFNGTNYIEVGDNMMANLRSNSTGSVAFWFNQESVVGDVGIAYGTSEGGHAVAMGGQIANNWGGFGGTNGIPFVMHLGPGGYGYIEMGYDFIGEWHHVAMVQEGDNVKCYLDGVNVTDDLRYWEGTHVGSTVWFDEYDPAANMRIGMAQGWGNFIGVIDDFRVSVEAWDDADVAWIWEEGNGRTDEQTGFTYPQVYAVTSNRTWTTTADEVFVSAQVKVSEANLTNVLIYASNTDPASWVRVPFQVDSTVGVGILSISGSTNFPSASTNMSIKVETTNRVVGVKLHGVGYGRR